MKKFYSALRQANIKAKAEGNDWEEWAESASGVYDTGDTISVAESFAKQYLLPYLNYTKTEINNYINDSSEKYLYIYLADGSRFYVKKAYAIEFTYDTNGDKKPNKYGRDVFIFMYTPYSHKGYMFPGQVGPHMYSYTKDRQTALKYCKERDYTCSGLLMMDGWEFKDDYPYKVY